jgi:glycosyltransferase involved in cell wall biosynthesis
LKVSGFTFIRNAKKYDYPIVEAITSILDVCDELIVMAGNSDDGTKQMILDIHSPKIKIHDSVWDESLREGGKVLAEETNKALDKTDPECDWAFYIQGDEVIHEKYLPAIKSSMEKWKDDKRVEGLLFDYKHFYGSYDYVGDSTRWYRKEVRIIRRDPAIRSFRDAQGFQKNGRPLRVKPAHAEVYHYGWVKPPSKQQEKQKYFHKLWHNDDWVKKNIADTGEFDYSGIDSLKHFEGTHPAVMQKRISEKNWKFSFDPSNKKTSVKSGIKLGFEKVFGFRIGEYKNYRLIK